MQPKLDRLEVEPLDPPEELPETFPTLEKMLPEVRDKAGEGVLNRGTGRLLIDCCRGILIAARVVEGGFPCSGPELG